jgi:hypothetical protein
MTFRKLLSKLFRARAGKHWLQRVTRGFDDSELWSLDVTIARFVLPRLRAFAAVDHGHPNDMTMAQWQEAMAKMVRAFELIVEEDGAMMLPGRDEECQEGLDLFARYFRALWD